MTSKRQLQEQLHKSIVRELGLAGENELLLAELARVAAGLRLAWASQDSIVGTFATRQPDLLRDPAPMPGPVV